MIGFRLWHYVGEIGEFVLPNSIHVERGSSHSLHGIFDYFLLLWVRGMVSAHDEEIIKRMLVKDGVESAQEELRIGQVCEKG